MSRDVFKKRQYVCLGETAHRFEALRWASAGLPTCECGAATEQYYGERGHAPAVIGDEIDIYVKHGLCHEDGTPQRFRSMTDLRRAASEKGLTIHGETPKPSTQVAEREAARQEAVNRKWGR